MYVNIKANRCPKAFNDRRHLTVLHKEKYGLFT